MKKDFVCWNCICCPSSANECYSPKLIYLFIYLFTLPSPVGFFFVCVCRGSLAALCVLRMRERQHPLPLCSHQPAVPLTQGGSRSCLLAFGRISCPPQLHRCQGGQCPGYRGKIFASHSPSTPPHLIRFSR